MIRKRVTRTIIVIIVATTLASVIRIPTFAIQRDANTTVSAGGLHTMVIDANGSLWAWGDNKYGQIGNGTIDSLGVEPLLSPVKIMENVIAISAGGQFSMAIKSDNSLWAWGYNNCGQLGDGTVEAKSTPVKIADDIVAISSGLNHSLAVKNDGSIYAWGSNSFGQIGDGTKENKLSPVKVMN